MAFLNRWLLRLGILILGLMAYVHWLVVKANQTTPASLASDHLNIAVLVFVLAMTGLMVQLLLRFRAGNRVAG